MTWLIDIVLVLIIAIAGYIGYKKGMVKMLLSFLTIVIALALAWGVSAPLADVAYDMFFEDTVSNTVDAALENTTQDAVDGAVEKLFDSGSIIGGLGGLLGFDTRAVVDKITGDSLAQVSNTLKNDIIKPPMVSLLRGILILLLFVLFWLILSIIARAICRTAKLPLVNGINKILGAFVGLITGVLLCLGVCALINLSLEINPNGIFGITAVTRENSVVYQFISDIITTF